MELPTANMYRLIPSSIDDSLLQSRKRRRSEDSNVSWSTYGVQEVRGMHKFSIKNFLHELERSAVNRCIQSPKFYLTHGDCSDLLYFSLGVFPKNQIEDKKDNLAVFLYNANPFEVKVSFEIGIESAQGSVFRNATTRSSQKAKISVNKGQGFTSFCSSAILAENNHELLPNGNLTLVCQLTVELQGEVQEGRHCKCDFPKRAALVDDLLASFKDSKFTDMKIECRGREFECHKHILAARSDVFCAMIRNEEFQEARNGEIVIKDMDPKTLEVFLRFLYTDKVSDEDLQRFAASLFNAAEKYNVMGLRDACEEHMCKHISVNTAVKFLILGHLYNADNLKRTAMKWVLREMKVIKTSSQWNLIKNYPSLALEICENIE